MRAALIKEDREERATNSAEKISLLLIEALSKVNNPDISKVNFDAKEEHEAR